MTNALSVLLSAPVPSVRRFPRLAACFCVALVACGAALLLSAESQWAVVAILGGFFALALAAKGTQVGAAIAASTRGEANVTNKAAFVAALALIVVFREEHYAMLMIATVAFFATACLGLNLQMAFAGVANFAGAAFFAVGAYTAALLMGSTAIPHILVLAASGLTAAIVGLILLLPVLRTRGHYAALVTIGFGVLLRSFLEVNDGLGGPQGLKIPSFRIFGIAFNDVQDIAGVDVSFYLPYAVMSVVLLALAASLMRRIENSWVGVALDMVRTDETAASVFGLNRSRWKAVAFMLGNTLIGVAGAGYGVMNGFVNPNTASLEESLLMISIVVLGGLGSLWGAVSASVIILVVPEKLQSIQEYRLLIFSTLVLLILLFRPGGILPRDLRDLSRFRGTGRDANHV